MSLTLSFLHGQTTEKSHAHEARCATIQNNLDVIDTCNKNAPAVIEAFKKKFARYQKDATNPSPWKKIQIAAAKKWNGQTSTEASYEKARENLRSLANIRKTATRGLRYLTPDPKAIISRKALVDTFKDSGYQNDILQENF
jgi:hypothetical protein